MERCRQFLATKAPEAARRAGQAIERQLRLLETTPGIGRPFPEMLELRELVIAFGDSGYVALCVMDDIGERIQFWLRQTNFTMKKNIAKITFITLIAFFQMGIISESTAAAVCEGDFIRPAYKTRSHYCKKGEMVEDAYAPGTFIPCEAMEVDHLISLRHAWDRGVCGKDLKRLANDPRNLKFTHWRTNRAKGYSSPEDFAKTLPSSVAKKVRSDAATLMKDYKILSRDAAISRRMLSYASGKIKTTHIALSSIPNSVRKKITTQKNRE